MLFFFLFSFFTWINKLTSHPQSFSAPLHSPLPLLVAFPSSSPPPRFPTFPLQTFPSPSDPPLENTINFNFHHGNAHPFKRNTTPTVTEIYPRLFSPFYGTNLDLIRWGFSIPFRRFNPSVEGPWPFVVWVWGQNNSIGWCNRPGRDVDGNCLFSKSLKVKIRMYNAFCEEESVWPRWVYRRRGFTCQDRWYIKQGVCVELYAHLSTNHCLQN